MTIEGTATSRLDHDLEDLRATLQKVSFPAWQDDILAALVVGRSPSRLLWRAGCLSRERLYRSADEVCADLAARPGARRG
jgi:hypothetical protein